VAHSPRLTARFLAQRKALHIEARSAASRAVAVQIAALCAADELPEPHHRSRIAPDPNDDRGIDILADIVGVTVLEGRTRRRLWLCYRAVGDFIRFEAIYDHPPPY
jgi:hypothetical protein